MKKMFLILATFVILGLCLNVQANQSDENFYYYKGEKFYLEMDYSRISVISEGKFDADIVRELIEPVTFVIIREGRNYTRQNVIPIDDVSKVMQGKEIFITEIEFTETLNTIDYENVINIFSTGDNVIKVASMYIVSGKKLGISNNFYVKLFNSTDRKKLLGLAEKYSLQVLGYNESMPLWFTLSCSKENPFNSIEIANLFHESSLFACSEPEFLYHDIFNSADTYFHYQWGIKNTGQSWGPFTYIIPSSATPGIDIKAEQAWQYSTGSNVIVGVYDDGFEIDHPDYINNVWGTGYDIGTQTTPAQVTGLHSTPIAGIIGSQQNNNKGISGVSPNAKLVSISMGSNVPTPQQIAKGFIWALDNDVDVLNCSWDMLNPSSFIENAIDSALIYGRNNQGMIIVFGSGNSNNTNILFPSNIIPDLLVVGAISPCGERKNYSSCDGAGWGSNYGSELDIVAPGVFIATTDMKGNNGYNYFTSDHHNPAYYDYYDKDYTRWFYGTSAAAPFVSGVCALVLSINPNLTGQKVRDIIESTAQKVGGYYYQIEPDRPNGTWHQEMGYGLVNAHTAVIAAIGTLCPPDLPVVHGDVTMLSNTQPWTWDTPVKAVGTITVGWGAELTITSEVKFMPGSSIIVKPGGKLTVDGGKLTNSCEGQLWGGISVSGNRSQEQLSYCQGVVELKNGAIIENAYNAIRSVKSKYLDGINLNSGGIITASNTTFRNNLQSIEYSPYIFSDSLGNVYDNAGSFTLCSFTIDNNNYFAANGLTFKQHISMDSVTGISFIGCTFENKTNINGKGIYAQDAGFKVIEYCALPQPNDCPCPVRLIPSIFENLEYGIYASSSGSPKGIIIDKSLFKSNNISAYIIAENNFRITRNIFEDIHGFGLRSVNSSGYRIEENSFYGKDVYAIGMTIGNSGFGENRIYKNSFENLYQGIVARGNNASISNPSTTGLQFLCNYFENNSYDIIVDHDATVRTSHGSISNGADNIFYKTGLSSFYNENTQWSVSYFHSRFPYHEPLSPYNVHVFDNALENPCASTFCSNLREGQTMQEQLEFYQNLQNELDNLLVEFEENNYGYVLENLHNPEFPEELRMQALMFLSQINQISDNMRRISDNAISTILQDSILNTEILKSWYEIVRTPIAKYLLAETHLFTGNYELADAVLNELPQMFVFSEQDNAEYANYLQFHNFKKQLQLAERNWSDLSETEIARLQVIAEANTGRSSSMAQGVLCFFYDICYENETNGEPPAPPAFKKEDENQPSEVFEYREHSLTIYPNPAQSEIFVTVSNSKIAIDKVELYDLVGRQVKSQIFEKQHGTLPIDEFTNGIYVIKVSLSDGQTVNRKLVIQK